MAKRHSYVSDCLRIDPGCTSNQEPFDWGIGGGRVGTRWTVRNGKGEVIGQGDPGNPRSAWWRAYMTLTAEG